MANVLGNFNPEFFAAESLIQLEKNLGMSQRVHRGYERERREFGKGSIINIKKPGTFTVQDSPATAEDIVTETAQLVLSQHKEVKFAISDRELAYTTEEIIADHIRPAAVKLADNVDQALFALYKDVANFTDLNASGSVDVSDITNVQQAMEDALVPLEDSANMHYMIGSGLKNEFLQLPAFSQQQGAGDQGINAQMTGTLGRKYGFELFSSQNIPTHTANTVLTGTPLTDGVTAKLATEMVVNGLTGGGALVKGDILTVVVAGKTHNYAVTADVAQAGSMTIPVSPAVRVEIPNDTAVVFKQETATNHLAFHRNAFALAMAPLPETGKRLGAEIATITDPKSKLSIRSRMYYLGDTSMVHVALDILYGVLTLDPDLANRPIQ